MNLARVLPALNAILWAVQTIVSYGYAHSAGLAILGLFGVAISALQWYW